MNKQSNEKPVTQASFDKEVQGLHHKIDNVALGLLNTQQELREMKETVATKDDVRLILTTIDHFAGEIKDYSRKAILHDYRFNEAETAIKDHEKRITALESPRQL